MLDTWREVHPLAKHSKCKKFEQFFPSTDYDETAQYWRMQPDRVLAPQQLARKKKDKTLNATMVTTNSNGSERGPLWIIGTTRNPRCFRNVDINSWDQDPKISCAE